MVTITLFDTFHVSLNGKTVSLPYRQTEAALAYLVVSFPEPVDKDLLSELLWPDRPPGVARGNLRHVLHVLRTTAGLGEYLVSSRSSVAIVPGRGLSCDYLSFLDITAESGGDGRIPASAVREALKIYGTGLLENFAAEPSREFGFWLFTARRTCANRLYGFLFSAIPGMCGGGDDHLLSETAEFLLLREPYDTSLYEFLLRSLISRGRGAAAERIHRSVSGIVGMGGDQEAINGLAEIARRLFPADSYPVKRRLPPRHLPFIGRERERAEIESLLRRSDVRLVTIAAPGGFGKTSLALAVGRGIDAALFPDGVFFASLRDCRTAEDAVSVLLSVFDLAGDTKPEEPLLRYLSGRKLLVILDEPENFSSAASLAGMLAEGCPELRMLAASRKALGLNIEWIYRLPPFAGEEDALRLFLLTAERKTGKRDWTERERELVGLICAAVDLVPLSVELAASGLGAADERSLESALARFGGEPGAGHGGEPGDMTDIIEYQVNLLSETARGAFPCLGLFHDLFERQAACGAFGIDGSSFDEYCALSLVWPAGGITEGVGGSAAGAITEGVGGLFRLHSRLRGYCLSVLERNGGFDSAVERLDAFLADACERHFARIFSLREDPVAIAERYPAELEGAFRGACARGDWHMAMRFAIPLGSYLHYHGLARKGRELFLELPEWRDPVGQSGRIGRVGSGAFDETRPEYRHGILHVAMVSAVLAFQLDETRLGRRILDFMRRVDALSGGTFLSDHPGSDIVKEQADLLERAPVVETLYRRYLSISFPWLEGLYALREGDAGKAEGLFRESRRRAVLGSAHLCRVYVEMYLAMTIFESDPFSAIGLLEEALRSSHGKYLWGIRSDILLLLARFSLAVGRRNEAVMSAEEVIANSRRLPGTRTEMEALFILAQTHIEEKHDREIPRTYLFRALDAAVKNGLSGTAVDSSLAFIRRWKEVFGGMPDWEVYDTVSSLARGPELAARKGELDRLFSLS